MADSLQFSVTRLSTKMFKVVVQNEKEILRSVDVAVYDILERINFELDQLKCRDVDV